MLPACGTQPYAPRPWLGFIRTTTTSFSYAPFRDGRRVHVYVPPGYTHGTARYPVLYMHDGQFLMGPSSRWNLDEMCQWLIDRRDVPPLIVVAIDNGGGRRTLEYTPFEDLAYPPGTTGGGELYLRAIRDTLKPEIDRRFRTLPDAAHTYMAGFSLGGLLSVYAGYTYSATWSRVLALSPTYDWDGHRMIAYAGGRTVWPNARFYQDMGTIEAGGVTDVNHNGVDDYLEDLRAMAAVARRQGFTSTSFRSVEASGDIHRAVDWAKRLPNALRFVLRDPAP